MKKSVLVLLVLIIAGMVFVGCATAPTLPVENFAVFPADGSKYEILGRVSAEISLLAGKGVYTELVNIAKKNYPLADDVVNVVMDKKTNASYRKSNTVLISGIAIRYLETIK